MFRSIKENAAGPEDASNPQNMSMQENSTGNSNSSEITPGNHPCGKPFQYLIEVLIFV